MQKNDLLFRIIVDKYAIMSSNIVEGEGEADDPRKNSEADTWNGQGGRGHQSTGAQGGDPPDGKVETARTQGPAIFNRTKLEWRTRSKWNNIE